ncbi:unnamed protein product [Heterosigma akashiwo]
MPEYPARTLARHVIFKGTQVGAFLGLGMFAPAYKLYSKGPMSMAMVRIVPLTTIAGAFAGAGMLYNKHRLGKLDMAGVDDRAYRITQNQMQVTVDKYAGCGALAGATAGVLVGNATAAVIITTASAGMALSMGTFVASKSKLGSQVREKLSL